MKTKHTKGPWSYAEQAHIPATLPSFFIDSSDSAGDEIGKVYLNGDWEEAEANAKLIAAAPELLEALRNLLLIKNLIQYPDDTKPEHQGEAEAVSSFISQAETVIKKATE